MLLYVSIMWQFEPSKLECLLQKNCYVSNLDWGFRGGILFKVLGIQIINFFLLFRLRRDLFKKICLWDFQFQFQASNASIPQFNVHMDILRFKKN